MAGISLRQVEAFKAVVEFGTVSLAAQALRISQPSLSKLVATLEHQSGVLLFDRKKGWLPMLGVMILSGFLGTLAGTLALDNIPERLFRTSFRLIMTLLGLKIIWDALAPHVLA